MCVGNETEWGNVSNGQLRGINEQGLFKCDQAKGVLAWLICQIYVSDHFEQRNLARLNKQKKEHTHTCQSVRMKNGKIINFKRE